MRACTARRRHVLNLSRRLRGGNCLYSGEQCGGGIVSGGLRTVVNASTSDHAIFPFEASTFSRYARSSACFGARRTSWFRCPAARSFLEHPRGLEKHGDAPAVEGRIFSRDSITVSLLQSGSRRYRSAMHGAQPVVVSASGRFCIRTAKIWGILADGLNRRGNRCRGFWQAIIDTEKIGQRSLRHAQEAQTGGTGGSRASSNISGSSSHKLQEASPARQPRPK